MAALSSRRERPRHSIHHRIGTIGEDTAVEALKAGAHDFALTRERPDRSAWSSADTVDRMRTLRRQRFDPRVLDALVDIIHFTDLTDLGADAPALVGPRISSACARGREGTRLVAGEGRRRGLSDRELAMP